MIDEGSKLSYPSLYSFLGSLSGWRSTDRPPRGLFARLKLEKNAPAVVFCNMRFLASRWFKMLDHCKIASETTFFLGRMMSCHKYFPHYSQPISLSPTCSSVLVVGSSNCKSGCIVPSRPTYGSAQLRRFTVRIAYEFHDTIGVSLIMRRCELIVIAARSSLLFIAPGQTR